jgi:hypothetical protein
VVQQQPALGSSEARRPCPGRTWRQITAAVAAAAAAVTAHLTGLHSAIKMLVAKLSIIQQQVEHVAEGEPCCCYATACYSSSAR